jgi:hypothetical protein
MSGLRCTERDVRGDYRTLISGPSIFDIPACTAKIILVLSGQFKPENICSHQGDHASLLALDSLNRNTKVCRIRRRVVGFILLMAVKQDLFLYCIDILE